MKQLAASIFFGKGAGFSGIIAFSIMAAIALGCTCGKNFDLANLGKNENSTSGSSNTSTDTPFGDDEVNSGSMPSDAVLQNMVKETTADFARAIDSNDFADLYAKSSSDFQSTYTEEQMKGVFKPFVDKKRLILPSINKVPDSRAEFSPSPSIRTENGLSILVLDGKFPTKPFPVKFEYEYLFRDGEWKLLKLIVKM